VVPQAALEQLAAAVQAGQEGAEQQAERRAACFVAMSSMCTRTSGVR